MENIEIKELSFDDINTNLLDHFNRYQKVERYWLNKNGMWALVNEEYVVDWDENKKCDVVKYFSNVLKEKTGYIYGAYVNRRLIGFSVLLNKRFGTKEQYIQLKFLHISLDYRHKGIGKKLFGLCVKKTKDIGVDKIYISANDSEDSQKFYLGVGCKDAIEINTKFVEEEPYDRQMEYEIV